MPLSQRVTHALTVLGNGFLTHRGNDTLRHRLRTGGLGVPAFYRQLRSLVYRLLFVLTAEDRKLLPDPRAAATARQRYKQGYALSRLRRLAVRPQHARSVALYRNLRVVMEQLSGAAMKPALGLQSLGSGLWARPALADLMDCALADRDLLQVIHLLAGTPDDGSAGLPWTANGAYVTALYDLYTSLRRWQPTLNLDAEGFALVPSAEAVVASSPCPPAGLVACLLDTALDPVLDEAMTREQPAAALLALKICDPGCGSGLFLHAAAERLATRLAAVRSRQGTPTAKAQRTALREVIRHCLYGVDRHEIAVEICQLSLALAAWEPGQSLDFVDRHIRRGDSLLGATPGLMQRGIPDTAFTPLPEDQEAVAAALRKRNQAERAGQMTLTFAAPQAPPTTPPSPQEPMTDPDACQQTAALADAWCAAFVWPKTPDAPLALTHDVFCRLQTRPEQVPATTWATIAQLRAQYGFFHWHVAFPDVFHRPDAAPVPEHPQTGWYGGFDLVLGHFPYARVKDGMAPERQLAGILHHLRQTGLTHLCPSGEPHTLALFLARSQQLIRPTGRVGCLLPASLATVEPRLVETLLGAEVLERLYDFTPETHPAPARPRHLSWCLLTLTGPQHPQPTADMVLGAQRPSDLDAAARHVALSASDMALLNPQSRAIPLFWTAREADMIRAIYCRVPVLRHAAAPPDLPWACQHATMLHPGRDAAQVRTRQDLEAEGWRPEGNSFHRDGEQYLPVYEGPMVESFDHRWAHYEGTRFVPADLMHRESPTRLAVPRSWVAARRVVQAASQVPEALLKAYEQRKVDTLLQVLAAWISAYHLQHGHATCSRDTLVQTYSPVFHALPPGPGSWAAASELHRDFPLTPQELAAIKRQPDVLLLARNLIETRCPTWFLSWREASPAAPAGPISASILPRVGLGRGCAWLRFPTTNAPLAGCLLANLTSLVVDFCARHKRLAGHRLTTTMFEQLPVLPPAVYAMPCAWVPGQRLQDWLLPRVLELTYTAWDLAPFARDCGYDGPPFRWQEARRAWLRAELDAAYCVLYGLQRHEVCQMLEAMLALSPQEAAPDSAGQRRQHIVSTYDALVQAATTAVPYQTQLAPPPADPRRAHARHDHGTGGMRRLPCRSVEPQPADKYKSCLPLLDLRTAVEAFAAAQDAEPEGWMALQFGRTLHAGMFVAQVHGHAMEPHIPDGAYCLFARQSSGPLRHSHGRIVLAHHPDIADPETGEQFTVKRYIPETGPGPSRSRPSGMVRLVSLHRDYAPIVLENLQDSEPLIIADLLAVLEAHEDPL